MINLGLSASLLYSSYIMMNCPCKVPCKCKYWTFVMSAGVPLAYVVYTNTFSE
jgi:hypothetical protein